MLLGDEQKGLLSKSELLESLRVYLDNKNRLQPIIGLGSIVECVTAHSKQALYLCEVCVCRLSKSDMRNHIMGSLHRYNYIKSWYPHLVSGWEESSDLSKLARPLMDMAKILEGQEGPGDVQLIEVEDDLYQKMATQRENDVITLISSIRGEPESQPEPAPTQPQRIVLLAKRPRRQPSKAAMRFHKTKHQMMCELSRISERNSCFFEGYKGTKPLIGLCCVVECKNENGQTCAFLCNCCCTRTKRRGITDHLTSSSHVFNYLMEIHPEKVKFLTAAGNDSSAFLQSLAERVEEDEGRGAPKVVTAPESICNRLEKKSYNWCVRMLCRSFIATTNNNQQRTLAVKGPEVNTPSDQGLPYTHTAAPSHWAQPTTWRKNKGAETVFNVSLPSTSGAVLLERAAFSNNGLPLTCTSPSSPDPDGSPSPEPRTEHFKLDSGSNLDVVNYTDHTAAGRSSQLQQDACNNDGGACQYVAPKENLRVSVHQDVNRYLWVNEQHPHNPYAGTEGYAGQCYNVVAQSKTGTEAQLSGENGLSSDAAWHHYQQQPQYAAPNYANHATWQLVPHSVGHHGPPDGAFPHVDATRICTYPHSGYSYAHYGSTAAEPRTPFHEMEQRPMQTYVEFSVDHGNSAPQASMTQPPDYQPRQFGYGSMADPSYNVRPRVNENQPFPHPVSGGNGVGAMYQPNVYVPSWQDPCYGAQSNMTLLGLSGVMSSGGDAGTVQLTQCNSQFKFCI